MSAEKPHVSLHAEKYHQYILRENTGLGGFFVCVFFLSVLKISNMNQKEVEMSMVGERGSLKYCTIKDIMNAGSFLKKKK